MNHNITIKFNNTEFSVVDDPSFVAEICGALPEEGADGLLIALAGHASTKVRCSIARRSNLPIEALDIFAASGNRTLRRELVYSDSFRAWASTDLLIEWCEMDEEFARLAAEFITEFEAADLDALFQALLAHSDPDVRRGLAESWNLPKRLRKQMLNDEDIGVRMACQKALE